MTTKTITELETEMETLKAQFLTLKLDTDRLWQARKRDEESWWLATKCTREVEKKLNTTSLQLQTAKRDAELRAEIKQEYLAKELQKEYAGK